MVPAIGRARLKEPVLAGLSVFPAPPVHGGATGSEPLPSLFHPLTPEEDEEMVGMISGAGPDIVWVGLSTPKQERWMAEHVGRVALQALGLRRYSLEL